MCVRCERLAEPPSCSRPAACRPAGRRLMKTSNNTPRCPDEWKAATVITVLCGHTHTHTQRRNKNRKKNQLLDTKKKQSGGLQRTCVSPLHRDLSDEISDRFEVEKLQRPDVCFMGFKDWNQTIGGDKLCMCACELWKKWFMPKSAHLGWTGWGMRSGNLFWIYILLFLRFKQQFKSEIKGLEVSMATLMPFSSLYNHPWVKGDVRDGWLSHQDNGLNLNTFYLVPALIWQNAIFSASSVRVCTVLLMHASLKSDVSEATGFLHSKS